MSFNTLPQELWDKIVIACDNSDLKSIRLVGKRCEPLATALTFANISVCLQAGSLKRLLKIAKSDRLRKHVQKLIIGNEVLKPDSSGWHFHAETFLKKLWEHYFLTARYPDIKHPQPRYVRKGYRPYGIRRSQAYYFKAYDAVTIDDFSPFPLGLFRVGLDQDQVFKLFKQTGAIFFEDEELRYNQLNSEYLKQAILQFPNLKTIHLSNNSNPGTKPSWGAKIPLSSNEKIFLYNPASEDSYNGRQLTALFRALALLVATSGTNLNLLHFVYDDKPTKSSFGYLKADEVFQALPIFQNLTHLEMIMKRRPGMGDITSIRERTRINDMLRGLPRLKSLVIDNEVGVIDHFVVRDCLPALSSDCLESVRFGYCILEAEGLQKFLGERGKTLKVLELAGTFLFGGAFKSIFEFMRNYTCIERLVLTSWLIELEERWRWRWAFDGASESWNLQYDPNETRKAVCDFVTHKSDDWPFEMFDEDTTKIDFHNSKVPGLIHIVGADDPYIKPRFSDIVRSAARDDLREKPPFFGDEDMVLPYNGDEDNGEEEAASDNSWVP